MESGSTGTPPSLAAAEPEAPGLGVYIHFPWCLTKCPYCDFVAYALSPASIDHVGYADAVLAELYARREGMPPRRLTTVFFGGGTPSLWAPGQIARVVDRVARAFGADPAALEVSLEADPVALDGDRVRALALAGVNRLSLGLQSLDDERLRFLGRAHTAREARSAVESAVRGGMPRVSADLIYAVAGQAPEDAAREARELVALGVTHLSAYGLTIEPGTPFGKLAKKGRLPLCDDEAMAAAFFAVDAALAAAGLEHYEVSNYAAPGQRAQHNLGYWRGQDYLGLGCGAYGALTSADGSARRYRNPPSPRAYLARAAARPFALSVSEEELDPPTRLRERIMLGLRMQEGLDLEGAARAIGAEPYPGDRRAALARLEARGRIVRRGSHIAAPRESWIWVDGTAAELF